jgi:hypothetical protein
MWFLLGGFLFPTMILIIPAKLFFPPIVHCEKNLIILLNPLGKRVNHADRTVITPDPMIGIDEIGLPEVFAKSLTYPVGIQGQEETLC